MERFLVVMLFHCVIATCRVSRHVPFSHCTKFGFFSLSILRGLLLLVTDLPYSVGIYNSIFFIAQFLI